MNNIKDKLTSIEVVYATNGNAVPTGRVNPQTFYYPNRKYAGRPIVTASCIPTA